jgi:hypothetical protein
MKTTKTIIQKQKNHAFGIDIYLLGIDEQNKKLWLEAPKWNCGWYWEFGYVETYTNNKNPHLSKDIQSHSHISGFLGEQEKYDFEKKAFVKGDFVHNLINYPKLNRATFTEDESWQLTELFKQFYLLKEMAEFCYKDLPGCNDTTSPVNHGDLSDWYDKINKVMIPAITAKIIEILTPNT